MTFPYYASAEQIMRDKTEYARKGIARGRSVIVLSYSGGVLLLAENQSTTLHKVGEIYDRIGFAAVGRYNEFENLRQAGIRYADTRGFSYDRRDVTGRGLANAYAQTLGQIFSEHLKPLEVEVCVAEVGPTPDTDELYRLTFDGSVVDEPGFVAMGGQSDVVAASLKETYAATLDLRTAVRHCVEALTAPRDGSGARDLPASNLEIAILERGKPGRAFRRIAGDEAIDLIGRPAQEAMSAKPVVEDASVEGATPEMPADQLDPVDLEPEDE